MRTLVLLIGVAGCADRPLPLPEATLDLSRPSDLSTLASSDLKAADLAAPDLPDLTAPDLPDLAAPDLPDLAAPDLGGPDLASGAADLAGPAIRFAPPRVLQDFDTWNSFAVGDFNGDGIDDLVARNGQNVAVLLGDSAQPLGVRVDAVLSSSYGLVQGWGIADFDVDGHLDVAVGVQRGVVVLQGGGDGTLQPGSVIATSSSGSPTPLPGDFYQDGFPDVAFDGWIGGLSNAHPYIAVLAVQTGKTVGWVDLLYEQSPHDVLTSDFDVDGHLDVVISTWSNQLLFMRGDGKGSLAAPIQSAGTDGRPKVADLDGDGVADLVFARPYAGATQTAGRISWWRGLGDGNFGAAMDYAVSPYPEFLAFADFDRDGYPDVAVGSNPPANGHVSAPLQVLRGAMGANLLPAEPVDTQTERVFGMVSGDFDGDGRPDLVIGQQLALTGGILPTRMILLLNVSP